MAAALSRSNVEGQTVPPFANAWSGLEAGRRVGRYVLERPLGIGGMGVVWAAHDEELARRVALKLVRRDFDGDEGRQNRLLREAQALARLSHPNVVSVHDILFHERQLVIALELVRGTTLEEWLKRHDRPWKTVLDAFREAGKGLVAAHAQGLVHRDFKPSSILRDDDGRVCVTDFGLARAIDAEPVRRVPERATIGMSITVAGALVGTPRYMSPEQIRGLKVDARSDQWSFCAALYEGLYGEPPFPGDRSDLLFAAVLKGSHVDSPANTTVPKWIRRVVLRGLSVVPDDRFASMEELLAALAQDPRQHWRRVGFAALAGAALGLAALAAFALSSGVP